MSFSGVIYRCLSWVVCFACSLSLVASPAHELVRSNGGEPQSLDPHLMEGPPEGWIAYDLYEGLVTYDRQGNLAPGQAESWKVSEDGRKWQFKLRQGLQWSDGKALTAEDFVYSYRRLANPETAAPYAWFLETMAVNNAGAIINKRKLSQQLGVKAVSDRELEFYLDYPVSYFPELLAFYGFLPVPRHVIEARGTKWTLPENAVSNGAFKLQDWQVNEKIRAVRNPLYWDDRSTKLDSVVYVTAGDELSRFRAGEIHMTNMLKTEHEKWATQHHPDWIRIEPWMSVVLLFLNLDSPGLQKQDNRRALAMALDRGSLAESGATGTALPAWQVVPANFPGLNPERPEELRGTLSTRVQHGKELLRGLKQLSISYCNNCGKEKLVAIAVAQEWQKRLGIRVQLKGYERKHFFSSLNKKEYEVVVIQWLGPYKDPASLLNILHSQSASNRSGYKSDEYDDLLKQARQVTGSRQRVVFYNSAEQLLMRDVPVIPTLHHQNVRLVSKKVKGYSGLNIMGRVYSRHLSLE